MSDAPDLLSAVDSGDFLDILKAQRRIIAEGLLNALDNTRPQYSNELNKLNKLIAEEQDKRVALGVAEDARAAAKSADDSFDAEAI